MAKGLEQDRSDRANVQVQLAHVFFTEESASLPQQVSGRPKGAKPDRSTVSPSAKSLSQVP